MTDETFDRWIYRDGPIDGENTLYMAASEPNWMRCESSFGMKLVRKFEGLTVEQVGKFYVAALMYKGPEVGFIEKLEAIVSGVEEPQ